ncbi:MAG: hypothetical protein Kow0058_13340 [Roseovarius sp.]
MTTRFVTIFDDTYDQPDCRAYYRMLRRLGYSNHAHAVPVFRAVLAELMRLRGLVAPRILDFASSYGIVTALMKHAVSAEAFLDRYAAPELDALDPAAMAAADRAWLAALPVRHPGARHAGLDVAANAVAYGRRVGLFDAAFAEDLQHHAPSPELTAWLAETDLIVECGSVAHLMPEALDRLLAAARGRRPWVVTSPVRGNERAAAFQVMADHGLAVDTLGLPPFPHRRFENAQEQARAIEIARAAGHDVCGLETGGAFHAQIYLARPPEEATAPATWPLVPGAAR